MIHGLDTSFMVAAEVEVHPDHSAAYTTIARLLAQGDRIAMTPQVLAEFVHTVSDARRFVEPLALTDAYELALKWWTASDTVRVYPDNRAVLQYLAWAQLFSLGRKRQLDTLLAATFESAGIASVLTLNKRDFAVYRCFQIVTPDAR